MVRVYLIASFIVCETLFFYNCKNVQPREFMLFLSNMLVFSIFFYAACLFYNRTHELATQAFKRNVSCSHIQFLIMMVILYLGFLMRATFYLIQFVQHDFWKKIKNFDPSTYQDEGYNWFIFLIFFQPFVNFFPIYFLSKMFKPKSLEASLLSEI